MLPDLSTLSAKKALAAKYAAKHGLDAVLVCAVIEQETGGTWDPNCSRYEEGFYKRYISSELDLSGNPIYKLTIPVDAIRSQSTEARERAFSWGLMQIMGQTAREFGFTGRFLNSLTDPDLGVDFGCAKLRRCVDLHPNDENAALEAYNGGSNPLYGSQVMARKAKYE